MVHPGPQVTAERGQQNVQTVAARVEWFKAQSIQSQCNCSMTCTASVEHGHEPSRWLKQHAGRDSWDQPSTQTVWKTTPYLDRQDKYTEISSLQLENQVKQSTPLPACTDPFRCLNTLGKILARVVARRLSYFAEVHQLLPGHLVWGRPGRSTEQALLVLADPIEQP